jgi:hypothetical protein
VSLAVQILAGLLPSVGVGFLFFIVIRSLVQADRRERLAIAKLDDAARAASAEDS